ncbi:bcl-2-like protein 12 isoform X2 [Sceloporus undulatus]|uniref:bcl-2-like protein 12 isoform X2 n=1 Tax=Sceloporus undulatus TaxID=8520 RepID=UPI001C4CEC77|nr:bcl-2-like protein 12 isoform X2 [Sceloporus undulatus]
MPMAKSPLPHRKLVEEETRLVLEAFLERAVHNGGAGALGHVGRGYHDFQSYMYRPPNEHAQHCPAWTAVHEEINRVEEKKHGFHTSFKRLLRRRPSPQKNPDNLPAPKDSLKRPKAGGEAGEKARQKRSFSFKNLLKKKGATSMETESSLALPQRPNTLPLAHCYCRNQPAEQQEGQATDTDAEGAEFYTLVAQKLDHLVKQQQLISPAAAKSLPSSKHQINKLPTDALSSTQVNSEELPGVLDEKQKEQILQRLIAILEEQAGVINEKIEVDPFLRNSISRLSYGSFSRLAEAFTSRAPPGVSSPQLAKLALTMELTRKVAGINSHAVHTLMGYSLQYMDMFIPWLQQQGGWENIVAQDEIFDLQLD